MLFKNVSYNLKESQYIFLKCTVLVSPERCWRSSGISALFRDTVTEKDTHCLLQLLKYDPETQHKIPLKASVKCFHSV